MWNGSKMTRAWNKLSANFVRSVRKRGRYADGGNLQLQIAKGGSKAWVFAYQRNKLVRSMGLGSARWVSLSLARCHAQIERGHHLRRPVRTGTDGYPAARFLDKAST